MSRPNPRAIAVSPTVPIDWVALKPPKDLESIVSAGLCTGCGLCQSLAGPSVVSLAPSKESGAYPRALKALSDGTMDRIRVTCPGIRVDGSEPEPSPHAPLDAIWGAILEARRAGTPQGGGLAEALADHLLDSKQVQGVVMVEGFEDAPQTGALTALRERLEEGWPLAVFGRPCDIAALRNLACLDKRVDRVAVLTISHFCSGLTLSGRAATGDAGEPLRLRCQVCPDSSGAQADISLGLAGDGPLREADLDDDAHSDLRFPLIGRSLRGEAVIRAAAAAGVFATVPLSLRELGHSYPGLVARKQDLWARLAALILARRPRPRLRNLSIWAAGRRSGLARRWRVFRAMRRELKGHDPAR